MDAQDEYGEENFRALIGAEALQEVLAAMNSKKKKLVSFVKRTWRDNWFRNET